MDIDDAIIAAGGNIAADSVLTIAQGTTESTRIGRKITIRHIAWRWFVELPAITNSANTSDIVRVILYLDRQINGATATVTGILETSNYQSFNNLANKSRFRILTDRTYTIQSTSAAGNDTTNTWGEANLEDSVFLKVNIPIEYDNTFTDGRLTTMRSNNIGVLLLSRSGFTVFESTMRLRFSDI